MWRDKEALAEEFGDEEWRRRLVRLFELGELHRRCLIADDYRVPDTLNSALELTEAGQRAVQDALAQPQFADARKRGMGPKEARAHCFLELFHEDLLIDVEGTNIEAIEQALDEQIKTGKIKYPLIFGRDMYDAAADMFEEARENLTTTESQRLLNQVAQGIFQVGEYLVGPFGLIKSTTVRHIPPTRHVPMFHCSDPSCAVVHSSILSTSWDAPVNDLRGAFTRALDRPNRKPSEWVDFIFDLRFNEDDDYDDFDKSTTPYLLGDALTPEELRRLATRLIDRHSEVLRGMLTERGITTNRPTEKIVAELSSPQIIQMCLVLSDSDVIRTLDRLIGSEEIKLNRS